MTWQKNTPLDDGVYSEVIDCLKKYKIIMKRKQSERWLIIYGRYEIIII